MHILDKLKIAWDQRFVYINGEKIEIDTYSVFKSSTSEILIKFGNHNQGKIECSNFEVNPPKETFTLKDIIGRFESFSDGEKVNYLRKAVGLKYDAAMSLNTCIAMSLDYKPIGNEKWIRE